MQTVIAFRLNRIRNDPDTSLLFLAMFQPRLLSNSNPANSIDANIFYTFYQLKTYGLIFMLFLSYEIAEHIQYDVLQSNIIMIFKSYLSSFFKLLRNINFQGTPAAAYIYLLSSIVYYFEEVLLMLELWINLSEIYCNVFFQHIYLLSKFNKNSFIINVNRPVSTKVKCVIFHTRAV